MEITYERILKLLRKNLLVILAAGILCLAGTYAYMKFFVAPEYYSDAKFYIRNDKEGSTTTTTADLNAMRSLTSTYIAILNTNNFFEAVRTNLDPSIRALYTAEDLRNATTFTVVNQTEVIQLRYTSTASEYVKVIAKTISETIAPHISVIYERGTYNEVDAASDPVLSTSRTTLYSVIGFFVGVLLAYLICFIKDVLDVHVKDIDDLVTRYNLPVLGAVPTFEGGRKEAGRNG